MKPSNFFLVAMALLSSHATYAADLNISCSLDVEVHDLSGEKTEIRNLKQKNFSVSVEEFKKNKANPMGLDMVSESDKDNISIRATVARKGDRLVVGVIDERIESSGAPVMTAETEIALTEGSSLRLNGSSNILDKEGNRSESFLRFKISCAVKP